MSDAVLEISPPGIAPATAGWIPRQDEAARCEPDYETAGLHQIIGTIKVVAGIPVVHRRMVVRRPLVVRFRIRWEVYEIAFPALRSALRSLSSTLLLLAGGGLIAGSICWLTAR